MLVIPEIVSLLSNGERNVRIACVDALSKLSEQGKVSKFSDPDNAHELVAEIRVSIRRAIPEIISLLSDTYLDVRIAGADALSKLSEKGKVSNFLTWMLLVYL